MSIPRKYDGIGKHHAYLAAIASAMGPAWSVSQGHGYHDLSDGTVWLRVSWRTQDQRLRFRGYYGQYRIVDTTAAMTREPGAVALQLLALHESARSDSVSRGETTAAKMIAWRAPRRAAQDLLAPFVASPYTSRWTCTGLDPDARVAVAAGCVRATVELNLDSSTCGLVVGRLTLTEVLEILAALDESRVAQALAALLAVPAAVDGAQWHAEDMLAPFVVSQAGLDPDTRVVVVAGRVRGRLVLSRDGRHCSLVMGLLSLPEVLDVLAALDAGRLADALAALLAVPAARPINN